MTYYTLTSTFSRICHVTTFLLNLSYTTKTKPTLFFANILESIWQFATWPLTCTQSHALFFVYFCELNNNQVDPLWNIKIDLSVSSIITRPNTYNLARNIFSDNTMPPILSCLTHLCNILVDNHALLHTYTWKQTYKLLFFLFPPFEGNPTATNALLSFFVSCRTRRREENKRDLSSKWQSTRALWCLYVTRLQV